MNRPIARGDTRSRLTISRPVDGLGEGLVILQKETPVGPDDTPGSIYFDRLFPMGVAAMLEAADQLFAVKKRQFVDARKLPSRRFADVKERTGEVTSIRGSSVFRSAQGRQIEVLEMKNEAGRKVVAAVAQAIKLLSGTLLGT